MYAWPRASHFNFEICGIYALPKPQYNVNLQAIPTPRNSPPSLHMCCVQVKIRNNILVIRAFFFNVVFHKAYRTNIAYAAIDVPRRRCEEHADRMGQTPQHPPPPPILDVGNYLPPSPCHLRWRGAGASRSAGMFLVTQPMHPNPS